MANPRQEHPASRNQEDIRARELGALWVKVHPIILAYIRTALGDLHSAEDVLQDTAATVAEKFSEYDDSRPFLHWVTGIARHKVWNYLRKHGREQLVFNEAILDQVAAIYQSRDRELGERYEALEACVEKMRGRSRKLLRMRYVSDLKSKEIAALTGMNPNAVSVKLHRVRQTLQKCIERKLLASRSVDHPSQGGT